MLPQQSLLFQLYCSTVHTGEKTEPSRSLSFLAFGVWWRNTSMFQQLKVTGSAFFFPCRLLLKAFLPKNYCTPFFCVWWHNASMPADHQVLVPLV